MILLQLGSPGTTWDDRVGIFYGYFMEYHDVTDGKPRKNWGLENDRTGVGIYPLDSFGNFRLRFTNWRPWLIQLDDLTVKLEGNH